jgi:hypothetical protein
MHKGRLELNVDNTGLTLIFFVSLAALTPFTVPFFTFFQLDPTYVLFKLMIPSHLMKNSIFGRLLLPTLRFFTLQLVALECCRIMSFLVVSGVCLFESTVMFIDRLKNKAKIIRHQFVFLMNLQNYSSLVMNLSKTSLMLGQDIFVFITAGIIVLVWIGYATVAFRSTIPPPYYMVLPMSTLVIQIAFRQGVKSTINCHEQSCALLQIWKHTVLRTHNRKFMIRKIEGMTPIRIYASALCFNFFYLQRSTMGTIFEIVVTHTVNMVLSVPAPNFPL